MSVAEDLAAVWDEAEARRGRRWAYPELEGPRTALVVVGLTRGLLQQAPQPQGALARLEALAEILRRLGGRVLWARPDDRPAPPGLALTQGAGRSTAAQDEFAEAAPRKPGDLVLRIRPPSVFFPGACFAPHLLREAGIKRVIFAGGLTHLEVESSVRDAVSSGFECLVAADCCLDRAPEPHLASLRAMHRSFADVRSAQELVGLLRRSLGMSAEDADDMVEEAFLAVSASAAGIGAAPEIGGGVRARSAPEPRPQPLRAPEPPQAAEPPEEAATTPLGFFGGLETEERFMEERPRREAAPEAGEEDEGAAEPSMEEILEAIRRSEAFKRASEDPEEREEAERRPPRSITARGA